MERSNLLCISSPGHSFCFVIYFKCVFSELPLGYLVRFLLLLVGYFFCKCACFCLLAAAFHALLFLLCFYRSFHYISVLGHSVSESVPICS